MMDTGGPLCDMTPEIAQMTEELAFKFGRLPWGLSRYGAAVIAYESLTALFDQAKTPHNSGDTRCMAMCVVSLALARSYGLTPGVDPRAGTVGSA